MFLLFLACIYPNAVYFTPYDACAEKVIYYIDQSKKNIYIQAYHLSNPSIINAIIRAKKRNVAVEIILDKNQKEKKHIRVLLEEGIPIWIDQKPKIAHSKNIIIDHMVITGSYNFTYSAEHYNTETLLMIDQEEIVKKFKNNFFKRRGLSYPIHLAQNTFH